MVLYEDQEKVVSFAKLMLHVDFVIFDEFSDVVECMFSLWILGILNKTNVRIQDK